VFWLKGPAIEGSKEIKEWVKSAQGMSIQKQCMEFVRENSIDELKWGAFSQYILFGLTENLSLSIDIVRFIYKLLTKYLSESNLGL
jgi:hypothetical protein